MELSEEMDQQVEVPKWMFKVVSGVLATLVLTIASTVTVAVLWLMLLTFGVHRSNNERRKSHKEMLERIEKIEKSAERIEEAATDPFGLGKL